MKRMKRTICLLLSLLLMLALGSAQAASLSVTGTATVTAEPDQAVLLLGVQQTQEAVADAQASVNTAINAILQVLEKNEEYPIAPEDITTASYDIYPRYSYEENEQVLTGYRAECMLSIVVRDVDRAGWVIDQAFAAGANVMDSIEFRLEDTSAVNDQALTLALENALHKAQLLAQAAGIDLNSCEMNLTVGSTGYAEVSRNALYSAAETTALGSASVRGGQLSFSATVSLTYTAG